MNKLKLLLEIVSTHKRMNKACDYADFVKSIEGCESMDNIRQKHGNNITADDAAAETFIPDNCFSALIDGTSLSLPDEFI